MELRRALLNFEEKILEKYIQNHDVNEPLQELGLFGFIECQKRFKEIRKNENTNLSKELQNKKEDFYYFQRNEKGDFTDLFVPYEKSNDDMKTKDFYPWTPLQFSSAIGNIKTTSYLIQKGSKLGLQDHFGRNSLQISERFKNEQVKMKILENMNMEEIREMVKRDQLFMIRGAKYRFCKLYNTYQTNLSNFLNKGTKSEKTLSLLKAFYSLSEEERYKKLNFISPNDLYEKNPIFKYYKGNIQVEKSIHDELMKIKGVYLITITEMYIIKVYIYEKESENNPLFTKYNVELEFISKPSELKFYEHLLETDRAKSTVGGLLLKEQDSKLQLYGLTCYHCICPKFESFENQLTHSDLLSCIKDEKCCDNMAVQIGNDKYKAVNTESFYSDTEDTSILKIEYPNIDKKLVTKVPFNLDLGQIGDTVYKYGMKTQYTRSKILDIKKFNDYDDRIIIDNKKGFSSQGDSGSLIYVKTKNNHLYPIAILNSGNDNFALGHLFWERLEDFNNYQEIETEEIVSKKEIEEKIELDRDNLSAETLSDTFETDEFVYFYLHREKMNNYVSKEEVKSN